ncbi:CoF synthetase [Flagellimonas myxillae]|uniref:CoF synthetase n=1 Tax=Flagellimonas myxillae TaxID=2942214 RepID=UPI00201EAE1B|nr:CoF synthetase [Muricauda myxillae]MCL6266250.1 CoF synthetase [Muricauda myxillae]
MNLLFSKLRYIAFWAIDAIKGGTIRKNLQDIKHSLSLDSYHLLQQKNEPVLRELLDSASQRFSYYAHLKTYKSLHDFPVVNKNIIRDNPALKLKKPSKLGKLHSTFTSGSTGTPFMVYRTTRKLKRNIADTIYFAGRSGYTLGDKLLYLRHWNSSLKKNKLVAFAQNIELLEVDELEPNEIQELLTKLEKDKSPKGWLAYTSALEKICDYLDSINSKPIECNVKSIIGMSEGLSPYVRSRMWYYFNTPMVSRYSNFENGILAQQTTHSNHFEVNWASYHLEILDFEEDVPVEHGALGRIVVTDLYNHAMPMIRYDTGDIGAMIFTPGSKFPVLKTVEGRKLDILLNSQGEMISPFKLMAILPNFSELKQIQFLQTEKTTYVIKINIDVPFPRENELVNETRRILGKDAQIQVEYVDEIPLLNSRKRKFTRNLYTERSLQYV